MIKKFINNVLKFDKKFNIQQREIFIFDEFIYLFIFYSREVKKHPVYRIFLFYF